MEKRGLSQEALKAIACVTMLMDHIGALFVQGYTLRIIGRIAFPIFCFLLVEGIHYTKDPRKYAFRMFVGMLLSEIPFDLAFRRQLTLQSQSVMVTLLLGFLAAEAIEKTNMGALKLAITAIGFALGQLLKTDYGGYGVLLIVLLSQARGRWWLQTIFVGMIAWMMNSVKIRFFGLRVPIEMFALLAMIPIGLYSGKKSCGSRALQWAFYLFYPVHLATLVLLRFLIESKII